MKATLRNLPYVPVMIVAAKYSFAKYGGVGLINLNVSFPGPGIIAQGALNVTEAMVFNDPVLDTMSVGLLGGTVDALVGLTSPSVLGANAILGGQDLPANPIKVDTNSQTFITLNITGEIFSGQFIQYVHFWRTKE